MKRLIVLSLASLMALGGTSFATPTPVLYSEPTPVLISEPVPALISEPVPVLINESAGTITVNGVVIEGEVKKGSNDEILVPLRAISEALGYNVEWFGADRHIELVKGTEIISLQTTGDSVATRKMVSKESSAKVQIIDSTSYVSTDFVSTSLNAFASVNEEGKVNVTNKISDVSSTGNLVIKEIDGDKIIAESMGGGEAHITLTEDTKYGVALSEDTLAKEDLKVGDTIKITHSSMMLMIYPPQYTAYSVEKMNGNVYKTGAVTEINENSILVGDRENGVVVNISEETKIVNKFGKTISINEIRKGNMVEAFHSMRMTRSLPPQSPGFEIVVDTALEMKEVAKEEGQGEIAESLLAEEASMDFAVITEVLEDRFKLKVGNDLEAYVVINEKTSFINPLTEEALTVEDFKVGTMIRFTHSPVMIMVYPSQYDSFVIEKLDGIAYRNDVVSEVGDNFVLVGDRMNGYKFTVNEETEIVDVSGNAVKLSAIEEGQVVKVYHSMMATASLPPMSHAVKIVVNNGMY